MSSLEKVYTSQLGFYADLDFPNVLFSFLVADTVLLIWCPSHRESFVCSFAFILNGRQSLPISYPFANSLERIRGCDFFFIRLMFLICE